MYKILLLVRRRQDLTVEQFREHYENKHAPLAQSVLKSLRGYVRNYPESASGDMPWYDVITEFWFDDEAGMKEAQDFANSEAGKVLEEDEARFMDRASMTSVVVREERTLIAG